MKLYFFDLLIYHKDWRMYLFICFSSLLLALNFTSQSIAQTELLFISSLRTSAAESGFSTMIKRLAASAKKTTIRSNFRGNVIDVKQKIRGNLE